VTYVADLTPFTVAFGEPVEEEGLIAVGWLARDQPFSRGQVPSSFVDVLRELCRQSVRQTRGFHECELCPTRSDDYVPPTTVASPHGDYVVGSAEIRVDGETRRYAAPDMIVHYVEAHSYQPPAEFVAAVERMALPTALETLIGGYFHQDWDIEGPTADAVLDVFLADTTEDRLAQACSELDAIVANPENAEQLLDSWGLAYDYTVEGFTTEGWLTHIRDYLCKGRSPGFEGE
jgi:hypothetical protein